MVLPLLIIVLLPKVVNTNDPEMRKVSSCYVFCVVWNSYRMIHIRFVIAALFCIYSACIMTVYEFSFNDAAKHNRDFKVSTWKIQSISFFFDIFFKYSPCLWVS